MQNLIKLLWQKLTEVLTSKRFVAFYWHAGAMVFATLATTITDNLASIDIPSAITVFIGLVIAQITKYLNTKKVENPIND